MAVVRDYEPGDAGLDLARISTEASITARPFFGRHGFAVLRRNTVWQEGTALTNFSMQKAL